jgi:hypothetical protein
VRIAWAILRRYWLHIFIVIFVVTAARWAYVWAYDNGARDCERATLIREKKALEAAVAERDRAIADRNEAQRTADRLAKLPAKVVEVVRANPSKCVLPRVVTDSVRKQVAETNSAIRSVR